MMNYNEKNNNYEEDSHTQSNIYNNNYDNYNNKYNLDNLDGGMNKIFNNNLNKKNINAIKSFNNIPIY